MWSFFVEYHIQIGIICLSRIYQLFHKKHKELMTPLLLIREINVYFNMFLEILFEW